MSGITSIIAAVARIPVNFIVEVGKDIKTLNEQAANKPPKLTDEEMQEAAQLLAAKRRREAQNK